MINILAQFKRLLVPCLRAPGGKVSLLMFAVAVVLNLAAVYASLRLTVWTGAFYSAVEKVNGPEAFRQIGIFALIVLMNSARGLAHEYIRQMLEMRWRRSLTDHAIGLWTRNKAYWHLAHGSGERIDNPDQRIAEDCRLFVKGLLGEALDLIGQVVGLFSYIALLWSLANFPLSFAFAGFDVEIPRYMLWAAFIYVGISSVVTHLLGRPLKTLVSEQQKREASFRFAMARWRTSFDEVALSGGEAVERDIFRQRFEAIAGNWRNLIRRELFLGCFTYPFRHSVLRIPLFVALPGYLAGHVAFGGLMQLGVAFSNVVTTLSWLIFSYKDLAALVATSARLDGFLQAAQAAGATPPGDTSRSVAQVIAVTNLVVRSPDGRELIAIDQLSVHRGEAIWMRGASGIGKTTLVKTLAGLWPHAEGNIDWPAGRTMFLPQKPYVPIGSIAEAAAYPARLANIEEATVLSALADVGLSHRAIGDDNLQDEGPNGLSGGEMQRIALARLLIHKPDVAVLDESTSALDIEAEAMLFGLLRQRLPDTSFIIIAHRKPLGFAGLRTLDLRTAPCRVPLPQPLKFQRKDMTDEIKPKRRRIDADATTIITRLPALGKLMIIGKANGATHERIGAVETVTATDGWLTCSGEHHASAVDPSLVAQVVFDTSSIMQEQVYPRLDFQDAAGDTLFAFVGFEGAGPFEAGVADLPSSVLPEKPAVTREQRPEVSETDPGAEPLKAALASGTPITIAFQGRGFRQSWTGAVEKVNPGMGFINVMRADFHLHLLGGTVASWAGGADGSAIRLVALDKDGRETGLSLAAESASAFAPVTVLA